MHLGIMVYSIPTKGVVGFSNRLAALCHEFSIDTYYMVDGTRATPIPTNPEKYPLIGLPDSIPWLW